jgi:hypothetical protein
LRGSTVAGLCRRDQRLEPLDDRRRQHLIEVFEREAAHAPVRRSDAVHGRVERIATDNRREQDENVFQVAGAVFRRRGVL